MKIEKNEIYATVEGIELICYDIGYYAYLCPFKVVKEKGKEVLYLDLNNTKVYEKDSEESLRAIESVRLEED